MPTLILASQSPRRKALLTESGYSFFTKKSFVSEDMQQPLHPAKTVEELARRKAEAVFFEYPEDVVLGADTVVACDDTILGKPDGSVEARAMLKQLSSRSHYVYTGVALLAPQRRAVFHAVTEVRFYPLDNRLIDEYIASEEPYDKAGAYGIQGKGRLFVEAIFGDYFNVVGLPISRTARELMEVGVYPSFT
ncbi:Maf family protein [Bacillus piscicola]|uniref:Maf family protein n=1 Tax=Bacillus piscicola TaxID=1632684 RepID=UPI001F09FC79|nr:Maf family protein [Bacillus piscicola]